LKIAVGNAVFTSIELPASTLVASPTHLAEKKCIGSISRGSVNRKRGSALKIPEDKLIGKAQI
jgi:hypothetical protein